MAGYRFRQGPIRAIAASGTRVLVASHLIAQRVGAGQLIKLLVDLESWMAVVIVGALMMVSGLFGDMPATAWVQIIKACLLLSGAPAVSHDRYARPTKQGRADSAAELKVSRITKGAVIGGFQGLISSVGLTVVSPSVWEATLGKPRGSARFPRTSPPRFSMTIGFVGIWLSSVLDRSMQAPKERALFDTQQVRSETGLGASGASGH